MVRIRFLYYFRADLQVDLSLVTPEEQMELRSILKGTSEKNKRKMCEKDELKPPKKVSSKRFRRSKVVSSRLMKLRRASSKMSSRKSNEHVHEDGHDEQESEPVVPSRAGSHKGPRGHGRGHGCGHGRGNSRGSGAKKANDSKKGGRGRGGGRGNGSTGRGHVINDEGRKVGCTRCRFTPKGCTQCRRPGYVARGRPGRPGK